MLRIPTYLGRSPIHGVGVFTAVFIPAGSVIWNRDPDMDWAFSEKELECFPEAYREKLRSWCYLDESGSYVLCGDNARFMNHSEAPNCDDIGSYITRAARDIQVGEELTCDYRAFDVASRDERAEHYVRRSA